MSFAVISVGEARKPGLQIARRLIRNIARTCERPQAAQRPGKVCQRIDLLPVEWNAKSADFLDLRRVTASGPDDRDLGPQGHELLHVDCHNIADARYLL